MITRLEHQPPNVHIVIATRSDPPLPLARWRVRNRMTEFRAADLRFTVEEAAAFLNEVMGLHLTQQLICAMPSCNVMTAATCSTFSNGATSSSNRLMHAASGTATIH